MAYESWIDPDDVADLAAHATAMVDAALVGTDLSRDVFWAAVRKGYNTPYNDPPRRTGPATLAAEVIPVVLESDVPPVVAPVVIAAELRAV